MDVPAPLVPAHVFIGPIGRVAVGEVLIARKIMGTYRAIKSVARRTLDDGEHFDREFHGIHRFEPVSRLHQGLIGILQVGRALDDSFFYYIMELSDDLEPRQEFS